MNKDMIKAIILKDINIVMKSKKHGRLSLLLRFCFV